MPIEVRRETVVFSALVAFVGWWQLDLPPLQRGVAVVVAVVVFAAVSYAIEQWRQAYLAEYLEEE